MLQFPVHAGEVQCGMTVISYVWLLDNYMHALTNHSLPKYDLCDFIWFVTDVSFTLFTLADHFKLVRNRFQLLSGLIEVSINALTGQVAQSKTQL